MGIKAYLNGNRSKIILVVVTIIFTAINCYSGLLNDIMEGRHYDLDKYEQRVEKDIIRLEKQMNVILDRQSEILEIVFKLEWAIDRACLIDSLHNESIKKIEVKLKDL